MRQVAGEKSGWKLLRPALTLLSARAAGGTVAGAVPAAVSVQLIHEFTLLHDDIMDHDEVRRGRPKAWRVFSTERALLAGDALLTLAVDVLARVGTPRSGEALRLLSESVMAVIRGQSADLAFEAVELISDEQAREVALGKTAALFGAACGMGA